MNCYKNLALFAGGILFGSAGVKLLASKDAKKVYTHAAAAALRMNSVQRRKLWSKICPKKPARRNGSDKEGRGAALLFVYGGQL